MTGDAPNVSTLWGRVLADAVVDAGVGTVHVGPGSRSTPLTLAFVETTDVAVYSHLDERSASFFALGVAKRTGTPAALVCTSGTAAANFHPAVIEADRSRTPLVVLTADRPPELHDSGANQTIDQQDLYGGAPRWSRTLPEPEAAPRKLRSLRVAAARAVATSTRPPAGPVHLNVPFRKPLEPTVDASDRSGGFEGGTSPTPRGRDVSAVRLHRGETILDDPALADLTDAVVRAERGLIVAGPADPPGRATDTVLALGRAAGFPVLADPLSGLRFGHRVDTSVVCGGYDAYLRPQVTDTWPDPDLVLRFGASPTSKGLREFLAASGARQLLVDPAGDWREATFTATDVVEAAPASLAGALVDRLDGTETGTADWAERFRRAEECHWRAVAGADEFFEGAILATVVSEAPDPATLVVSNSMPVRDLDRFGRPSGTELTVIGNRGASGVDGVTSTALGAGSATDDPLVLVTGDLAFYHDMNGLLAASRCGVDATVVLINNDGGGIFHMLPIAEHDAFEEWFRTPHGLDFEPTADLYALDFDRVSSIDGLREAYLASVDADGTQVIEVESDAEESFVVRERLAEEVRSAIDAA